MRHGLSWLIVSAALLAAAADAQLLPPIGDIAGQLGGITHGLDDVGKGVAQIAQDGSRTLSGLAQDRLSRLADLVRSHPDDLEQDMRGDVVVRGELIALDPDAATLKAATAAGFTIVDDVKVEGLDLRTVRLRVPKGMRLRDAQKLLSQKAPGGTIQSNPIYERSGIAAMGAASAMAGGNGAGGNGGAHAIGLVDGGIASHPALPPTIVQKGFAMGAPFADAHGTAIASIMIGRGPMAGVAPGARLYAADIYGRDPRGGSALAIAQAMGWLVQSGVSVINLSLAGPDSPLLARAVATADAKGVRMVAAVGNDGAAAPPAYPASYAQVIAVTGIDSRGRALIEAGRATHIDFAAPGAGVPAARMGGRLGVVRGTSFAAPFVTARLVIIAPAGRMSRDAALALLTAQAVKPSQGASPSLYGRGIICGDCIKRKKI
jgi:hypothetical protein